MHPNNVLPHVGSLVEPPLAVRALEGLLVGVASDVVLEVAGHREKFVAASHQTLKHAGLPESSFVVDGVCYEPVFGIGLEGVAVEVHKLGCHDIGVLVVHDLPELLLLLGLRLLACQCFRLALSLVYG